MKIPEGYDHKATSDSFNGGETVSIYFNRDTNRYMIYVHANQEEDGKYMHVSKTQLETVVHAASDVLDDDSR